MMFWSVFGWLLWMGMKLVICANEYIKGTRGRMSEWMNEWMNEWLNLCYDGWRSTFSCPTQSNQPVPANSSQLEPQIHRFPQTACLVVPVATPKHFNEPLIRHYFLLSNCSEVHIEFGVRRSLYYIELTREGAYRQLREFARSVNWESLDGAGLCWRMRRSESSNLARLQLPKIAMLSLRAGQASYELLSETKNAVCCPLY